MATPTYKGPGQPVADNGGFFGGLGSWFGGSAPAYAGKGQPSGASRSYGGSPGYKPAPAKSAAASAVAPGMTVIDGEPLGSDSIALVIPRDLVGRLVPQNLLEEPQQ